MHTAVGGSQANGFGRHDFVGAGILEYAVLVNASTVGECLATNRLVEMSFVVSTLTSMPRSVERVRIAITTSSVAALPARSPRPLMQVSTRSAPLRSPSSALAT